MENSAEENSRTPEGRQLQQAFEKQVATLVPPCMEQTDHNTSAFTVFVSLAKDGKIQRVIAGTDTGIANCVFQRLMNIQLSATTTFPGAPHDGYWVKVAIDPSGFLPKSASQN